MNSTSSEENLASTSLHRLWRQRQALELNEKSEDTLRYEAAKLKSLIIIHAENGVLFGVLPVQWGNEVDKLLESLIGQYKVRHITDQASIYKYLRAWNRS